MPNYAYTDLRDAIIKGAQGISTIRTLVNRAAREVASDIDLRSMKRKARLAPNIYQNVFTYGAPTDIKDQAIVDVVKQVSRIARWELIGVEEFDSQKNIRKNLLALSDYDFIKKILISAELDTKELVLHEMDSITGDGTWAIGGSGTDLRREITEFINGAASLEFDAGASYTSITLENSTTGEADLTDYEGNEIFVWVYIPSTTGLTSFKLRWGSSSSDYWEATATLTSEGLAFATGWNLLRFTWPATDTGSPDISAVNYLRLEIVGGGTAGATTNWRVDFIVARTGSIHDIIYYSIYPWQTSAGSYLKDSANDTDKVNCSEDEYELFILKGKEIVYDDIKSYDEAEIYRQKYEVKKEKYLENNPSQRLLMQSTYREFDTREE